MKIRVCLVKHLVENTCITLTEMLSKIRVYSIIPTFSTSSDFHTYWVLIFHFYSQHGVFCPKTEQIYSGVIFLFTYSVQQKSRDNETVNHRNQRL